MNRVNFGKLISALRAEIDDEDYHPWTQKKLADETGLSEHIIRNIEQGRRRLDSETLIILAEALRLTSGERKEFFLAASGVEYKDIAQRETEPAIVLNYLIQRMERVYLPAYIIDSFCDVIAVNSAVMRLLDLDMAGLSLETMRAKPFGLNMLQFVFSDKAVEYYQKLMGKQHWLDYAYQNMMIFRNYTLRYRSTDYFQELLEELKKLPHFKKYWREWRDPYWREEYFGQKDHFIDNEYIYQNSRKMGALVYFSTAITALTTFCDLHFCVYVPATSHTANMFLEISQDNGADIMQVSPWPKK